MASNAWGIGLLQDSCDKNWQWVCAKANTVWCSTVGQLCLETQNVCTPPRSLCAQCIGTLCMAMWPSSDTCHVCSCPPVACPQHYNGHQSFRPTVFDPQIYVNIWLVRGSGTVEVQAGKCAESSAPTPVFLFAVLSSVMCLSLLCPVPCRCAAGGGPQDATGAAAVGPAGGVSGCSSGSSS